MAVETPGLKMGPLDPDATAEFGQVSGKVSARQLVRRHRQLHPQALIGDLTKKVDEERSTALDHDEVVAYAGDEGVPGEVVGHNVRGERDRPQVVCVTYQVESGRTAKASLPYTEDALPSSFERGTEEVAIAEAKERGLPWLPSNIAAALAKGSISAREDEGSAPEAPSRARLGEVGEGESYPDTAGDDELREQVAELGRRVEEAEQRASEAEQRAQDAEQRVPEPYPGYADANVGDVKAAIEDAPEGVERELLKRRVREVETERDEPRKGVLEATEPVELVLAGQADED